MHFSGSEYSQFINMLFSNCFCTHKNLYFLVAVFAKRRIRLNPLYISQFILNTDLDGLLSEHCELLLQIVPQEKEVHHCTHTHTHCKTV